MPAQDTSPIKEKIISILRLNGPSLPVFISGKIESNTLFTSAFLSELLSEKKLRISNMKVGNSPLYFIQGQEPLLEKFSHHLKSKEKEAFTLLKEKKFLSDSKQHPAIRVALREIKDFALPFKHEDEIVWRFFTIPEEEFKPKTKPVVKEIPVKIESIHKGREVRQTGGGGRGKWRPEEHQIPNVVGGPEAGEKKEKTLDIFDKPVKGRAVGARGDGTKIKRKQKTSQKENKFFEKVKGFLSENSIELLDIESFSKNEIILRVRERENEKILFAYNRKRISDRDIIKASKKASEFGMPYRILSLGEPLKKIKELIEAAKNLSSIEKIK